MAENVHQRGLQQLGLQGFSPTLFGFPPGSDKGEAAQQAEGSPPAAPKGVKSAADIVRAGASASRTKANNATTQPLFMRSEGQAKARNAPSDTAVGTRKNAWKPRERKNLQPGRNNTAVLKPSPPTQSAPTETDPSSAEEIEGAASSAPSPAPAPQPETTQLNSAKSSPVAGHASETYLQQPEPAQEANAMPNQVPVQHMQAQQHRQSVQSQQNQQHMPQHHMQQNMESLHHFQHHAQQPAYPYSYSPSYYGVPVFAQDYGMQVPPEYWGGAQMQMQMQHMGFQHAPNSYNSRFHGKHSGPRRGDMRHHNRGGGYRGHYTRYGAAGAQFENIPWDQLVGRINEIAWDQQGCRLLQQKIDEGGEEKVETILSELQGQLAGLMADQFGNYLAQRVIDASSPAQLDKLIVEVSPRLHAVACNVHGTRAVQKLVDCVKTKEQMRNVSDAMQSSVVDLIKDTNGNHVITRCLHRNSPSDNQFIYDAVTKEVMTIATHRHGCCVLQRCIDFADADQAGALAVEIASKALHLVQDAYGNYVVQYVLDMRLDGISEQIMHLMRGNYVKLSLQKFSSNVIEKCVQMASTDTLIAVLNEFEAPGQVESLLRDQYGNYVVQRLLACLTREQTQMLIPRMMAVLLEIRTTPHGRKICTKLQKTIPELAAQLFEHDRVATATQ